MYYGTPKSVPVKSGSNPWTVHIEVHSPYEISRKTIEVQAKTAAEAKQKAYAIGGRFSIVQSVYPK